MATKQQEELAAWLIAAGISAHAVSDIISRGRLTRAETGALIKIFKKVVPAAARFTGRRAVAAAGSAGILGRAGAQVARRHPVGTAALAGYIAHTQGLSMDTARAIAEQELEAWEAQPQFFLQEQLKERIREFEPTVLPGGGLGPGQPAASRAVRRKISKANKAVKEGMKILKGGGKAISGTVAGKLPKGAFKIATKAAGLANPKTKSKIGKGKSTINKLARRLKKWW